MPVVRRHIRRRVRREPAVERTDIPRIETRRKWKLLVRLSPEERAIVTRGERLATIQGIPGTEWREHIYSTIDELLGWNVVPPTTLRITADGERVVSAQEYIHGATDFSDIADDESKTEILKHVDGRRLMQIALLDAVLAQYDRHSSNIVVDRQGRPWAIDNEASLRDTWTSGRIGGPALQFLANDPIPPDLLADLRNLRKGDFYAALAGIEPYLIDAAWARKQDLIRSRRILF